MSVETISALQVLFDNCSKISHAVELLKWIDTVTQSDSQDGRHLIDDNEWTTVVSMVASVKDRLETLGINDGKT